MSCHVPALKLRDATMYVMQMSESVKFGLKDHSSPHDQQYPTRQKPARLLQNVLTIQARLTSVTFPAKAVKYDKYMTSQTPQLTRTPTCNLLGSGRSAKTISSLATCHLSSNLPLQS